MQWAIFGGGCFWAIERAFAALDGVVDTRAGYMGGHVESPTYDEVCTGTTGHVEVVEVEFDPEVIEYAALVDHFWTIHDPTTWEAQGVDEGPQYRSLIFTQSAEQAAVAEASLERAALRFDDPIVTELRPAETFWVAEDDHQRGGPSGLSETGAGD